MEEKENKGKKQRRAKLDRDFNQIHKILIGYTPDEQQSILAQLMVVIRIRNDPEGIRREIASRRG